MSRESDLVSANDLAIVHVKDAMLPALLVERAFDLAPGAEHGAAGATLYRCVVGNVLWNIEVNRAAVRALKAVVQLLFHFPTASG